MDLAGRRKTSRATSLLQEAIAAQSGAQRLLSAVQLADSFELEIIACPTPLHAKVLIAWLSERLPDPRPVCHLAARRSEVTNRVGMEEIARDILGPMSSAKGHRLVYLDASTAHIDEHAAWRWMFHRLNERRNALAAMLSSPLIMLLPRWLEPVLPAEASDLWSIRSVAVELSGNVNATLGRGELEELRLRVDDELIPLTATLDDAIERARALRTQAAIRARQGDLDAALEILQSLVLPIVEQDDAERAAALGEIADVLEQLADVHATVHAKEPT